MSYAELEGLLKQAMGLDAASIGASAVERAVQARMTACAIQDIPAYAARARGSAAETQALIEAVVVPETWFFRDCEAFAALTQITQREWLPAHAEGTLRLLSVPCSSGEEPYSMAMALLDAGISADRFRIDAFDISSHALASARRATYARNSFRRAELGFRERHFEATAQGYRLHRRVREQVNFHQTNLLDVKLSSRARAYDFIFCRNLLIYFDRETQDRAVRTLQGLLAARGVLFVGPSEAGLMLDHGLVPAKIPLAFAFRAARRAAPARAAAAPRLPIATRSAPPRAEPVAVRAKTDRGIEAAIRLADHGKLEEATKCCEEHLLRSGPSAQLYCLMGVVRAASGKQPEAEQLFRKALYLDTNHYDALLHLALLLEKRGSAAEAKVLRARISRLEQQVEKTLEH